MNKRWFTTWLVSSLNPVLCLSSTLSSTDAPTFWGYVAAPHAPTFVSKLLASGQIAVILDLDETLLLANTAQSLDTAISRRETELRPALEARLAKAETEEDRSVGPPNLTMRSLLFSQRRSPTSAATLSEHDRSCWLNMHGQGCDHTRDRGS